MYLGWVKWVVLFGTLASLAWVGYTYYYDEPMDGAPCERDIECDDGTCLADQGIRYCTRPCTVDEECLPGWRCLQPISRSGLRCIQPAR